MPSIRIDDDTKEKLDKIKNGKSYNRLIYDLVENRNDVVECETVGREKIAFQLQYFSYDTENLETYDVSFYELSNCKVGDVIEVPHKYNDSLYYSEKALIVYKDDVSAIVRIEFVDVTGKSVIEDSRLLNVVFY